MDVEASDKEWTEQVGPVLTEAAVGRLLGRSPDDGRHDRRLLRLSNRDGAVGYPVVQFGGSGQLPGVGEVVLALASVLFPLTVASWLTAPNRGLAGQTPIGAMKAGGHAEVLALARQLASSAAN